MKRVLSVLFAVVASSSSPAAQAQTCACGPTYCVDTPGYTKALASKKKALQAEHPPLLVALFDKLDHCEASIQNSPDGFSLFRVDTSGAITIDTWNSDNEKIGAAAVEKGTLRECHVIVTRRAFECCGSTPYNERGDYNKTLDLNTTATIKCSK